GGGGSGVGLVLMVSAPPAAPCGRKSFRGWCEEQPGGPESHGYNTPEFPAPALQAWFRDIIKTFPPMNDPLARHEPDDSKVTDYSLGRSVIYGAFAWSEAEAAHKFVKELAAKHSVGFFDVSANEGDIWFPTALGKLERLNR